MANRYDASENPEAQFEPGSDGRVLRNKLGIRDPAEMDRLELLLLTQLYRDVQDLICHDQKLRVNDLREWHRRWLSEIYPWAGQERTVNMSKGGFTFAMARQIPHLLEELDSQVLSLNTPCHVLDDAALARAISIVHVELILIHPFREGNGRLARLLAHVMAAQAGKPALDFSPWEKNKQAYFQAIRAGLTDYKPMEKLVITVLRAAETPEGA